MAAVSAFWRRFRLGDWSLAFGLLILALIIRTIAPHHRVITSNDDPALSFPVIDAQVPGWLLLTLAFVLSPLILILVFLISGGSFAKRRRDLHLSLLGLALSVAFAEVWTSVLKKSVGRPRPNFYALCGWDPIARMCTKDEYNARQSFPSGHSSLSFASLGFVSAFLYWRFLSTHKARRNRSWKAFVLLTPLYLAGWVAQTRLHDYWHSYADVAVGSILGCVGVMWAHHLVLDVPREKLGDPDEDEDEDEDGEGGHRRLSEEVV